TAAIGLSYDGYTRSVLLPQGRFAEFLTGDPNKRRDILTQLLGLSLFKRMAERARSIGAEAKLRAQTMMEMVEREFADATPEAMKEARLVAKEAAHRESALGRAGEAGDGGVHGGAGRGARGRAAPRARRGRGPLGPRRADARARLPDGCQRGSRRSHDDFGARTVRVRRGGHFPRARTRGGGTD